MNTQDVSKIIQITDCHLFGDPGGTLLGINTRASFDGVLELIKTHSADASQILVTGDISQDDSLESYHYCQEKLATLGIPNTWLCGNHDDPDQLAGTPFSLNFVKQIRLEHWQVLLLHTRVKGAIHGELAEEELAWAADSLQTHPDRPTLIVTHHHPLQVGSEWMDAIKLRNSHTLFELLTHCQQARLLIHGHAHQHFEASAQGITVLGAPSTCVQFLPDSPDFAVDTRQPGYREIMLYPDGRFTSKIFRLPPSSFLPDLVEMGY